MSEAAKRMRQTYDACGDKWFLRAAEEIEQLETAVSNAIEAIERGSTSAPVLEALKAALPPQTASEPTTSLRGDK